MQPSTLSGPEAAPKSGTVKRLVIFLHGVGADGNDLISLSQFFEPAFPDTQFLSPNAPQRFDMAPFGYQWFSLQERSATHLLEGARNAAPSLNHYIDAQRDRFKLRDADIALVGFSQGTMMALYTAVRRLAALAGIVGFSGMLAGPELLPKEITAKPPICLIHGKLDEVVPFSAMAQAANALKHNGVSVETHARAQLGHGIDPDGLEIATAFLQRCFGTSASS